VKAETQLARAAKRYRDAQARLEDERAALQAALVDARAAGMTLDAIGAVLGVSRQRVLRMLAERQ
jgi:hypothetical protein